MNTTTTTTEVGGFSSFINGRGLSVFMLLLSIVILGFLIANAVYFNKLKNDLNQTSTTKSQANTMMWINIVLAIIMGLFVFYYAWKSLSTPDYVKTVQQQLLATGDKYYAQVASAGTAAGVAANQAYNLVTTPIYTTTTAAPPKEPFTTTINKTVTVPTTLTLDNAAQQLYKDPASGAVYKCPGGYNCAPVASQNVIGLVDR